MLANIPSLAIIVGGIVFVSQHRLWRGMSLLLALVIGGTWAYQANMSLITIQGRTAPHGMGTTLESVRDIALMIPKGQPLIIHSQSDDEMTRGEPATWRTLLWDENPRIINGWTTLIIPQEPALLMTDADGMPAWEEWQAFQPKITMLSPVDGAPPAYISSSMGASQLLPDVYTPLESPIDFDSGLRLVAWRTRSISGRFRVSLVYEVVALPQTSDTIQQFTHLRQADHLEGAPDFISDIPLGRKNWRVGDRLISLADFMLPEGTSTDGIIIDTGQYRLETGARFHHATGDYVRIGTAPS